MKKYYVLVLLFFAPFIHGFALDTETYQTVKTDTITVNGAKFHYRKLGENNGCLLFFSTTWGQLWIIATHE
ncbi:MAG TPA: hypothetical protein VJ602_05345 [Paludibacter sp.]|nr:hypothetical protein [Paludibacter sp.]